MTSPQPPTGHWALVCACTILAINGFITTRFVINIRRMIELQSSGAIQLPIASPTRERGPAVATLDLTVRADGTMYAGRDPIATDSIAALLQARSPKRIVIHAERGAQYERIKTLLLELRKAGANDVILKTNETR